MVVFAERADATGATISRAAGDGDGGGARRQHDSVAAPALGCQQAGWVRLASGAESVRRRAGSHPCGGKDGNGDRVVLHWRHAAGLTNGTGRLVPQGVPQAPTARPLGVARTQQHRPPAKPRVPRSERQVMSAPTYKTTGPFGAERSMSGYGVVGAGRARSGEGSRADGRERVPPRRPRGPNGWSTAAAEDVLDAVDTLTDASVRHPPPPRRTGRALAAVAKAPRAPVAAGLSAAPPPRRRGRAWVPAGRPAIPLAQRATVRASVPAGLSATPPLRRAVVRVQATAVPSTALPRRRAPVRASVPAGPCTALPLRRAGRPPVVALADLSAIPPHRSAVSTSGAASASAIGPAGPSRLGGLDPAPGFSQCYGGWRPRRR